MYLYNSPTKLTRILTSSLGKVQKSNSSPTVIAMTKKILDSLRSQLKMKVFISNLFTFTTTQSLLKTCNLSLRLAQLHLHLSLLPTHIIACTFIPLENLLSFLENRMERIRSPWRLFHIGTQLLTVVPNTLIQRFRFELRQVQGLDHKHFFLPQSSLSHTLTRSLISCTFIALFCFPGL